MADDTKKMRHLANIVMESPVVTNSESTEFGRNQDAEGHRLPDYYDTLALKARSNRHPYDDMSEAEQEAVIDRNPNALLTFTSPSDAIQLAAIKRDPYLIKSLIKTMGIVPSEAVQLAAVTQDGQLLKYINNPSPAVKAAAEKELTPYYASDPTMNESINTRAINKYDELSEETQIELVYDEPLAIRDITNPSEAVQLAAVQQNGYAIEYIDNPSEDVQLAAIEQNPYSIELIDHPTAKVSQLAAQKLGSDAKGVGESVRTRPSKRTLSENILDELDTEISNKKEELKAKAEEAGRMFGQLITKSASERTPEDQEKLEKLRIWLASAEEIFKRIQNRDDDDLASWAQRERAKLERELGQKKGFSESRKMTKKVR